MKKFIKYLKQLKLSISIYYQLLIPYLFMLAKWMLWPFTLLAFAIGRITPKAKPVFIVNRPLQVRRCSAWLLMLRGMNPRLAFLHQEITLELGRRKYPVIATTVQRSERFVGWEYITTDGDQTMVFPECCLETLVVTAEEVDELDEMAYKQHADDIQGIVSENKQQ